MSSQITIPPFIPFIIFFSVLIGEWIVGGQTSFENNTFDLDFVKNNLFQYVVGSFVLASFTSILFGFFSYLALRVFNKKNT